MSAKNIKGKKLSSSSAIQMPTHRLKEILDSPHTSGIDGHDYHVIREELQSEYWRRLSLEDEKTLKHFEKLQSEHFKHIAKAHKKGKTA